jgi:hypothetical protein
MIPDTMPWTGGAFEAAETNDRRDAERDDRQPKDRAGGLGPDRVSTEEDRIYS